MKDIEFDDVLEYFKDIPKYRLDDEINKIYNELRVKSKYLKMIDYYENELMRIKDDK